MEFFDKQIKAEDLIGMPLETLEQLKKNLNSQKRPSNT